MSSQFKQPLATRMRPSSLNDVVGQDHLIGEGKILTRMMESKTISSIILYGPPGIGKTSIAHALSGDLGIPFEYFNAGIHAKKDLQEIAEKGTPTAPVIILLDEVHRLDKTKQDYLLHQLEEGSLIMVGATTENPYISIAPAIRSRSQIFELKPVSPTAIVKRLEQALKDPENGLGDISTTYDINDLEYLAKRTNGDLRSALNTLELVVVSRPPSDDGTVHITQEVINTCIQNPQIGGDKNGDSHYNLLSAFQKSIRGSDVDATLHYLARLIQNGDIISIFRRLLVIAYEDIGLANPSLPSETLDAIQTAERVGLPEARIPLAYIAIRLALSPKSNVAYKAIDLATEALKSGRNLEIPKHLKDGHYKGAKALGNSVGYKYPHDYAYAITKQQYLPDEFQSDRYLQFRDDEDTKNVQEIYYRLNQAIKP